MPREGFKKGEYEDAVELARDMLREHAGMSEIVETTRLTEADVHKIQNKLEEEFRDRS